MHTHKTTRLRFTSIFLILLGLLGTSLYAQDATGRIIGVVTDATGAVVPSARIIVTNVATNISTEGTTGPDGSYQDFRPTSEKKRAQNSSMLREQQIPK